MQGTRIGVVTATQLGSAFIDGLSAAFRADPDHGASLSLLMGLHPSLAPATVGYADVLHTSGHLFEAANYFASTKADDFDETIFRAELDFLFVVSVSQLVSKALVAHHTVCDDGSDARSYRRACVGAHPSPLPIGRGRAPIPWTILKGLTDSAVTTFVLGDGADDGPIVSRHACDVPPGDTATALYGKIRHLHAVAGAALAKPLATGVLVATPQDDSRATRWAKRTAADAHVSSASDPAAICRLVAAAQPPYPPAFIVVREHRLDIARAEPLAVSSPSAPGAVLQITATYLDVLVAGGAVRLYVTGGILPDIRELSMDGLLIP